jgi:hypothetical protein
MKHRGQLGTRCGMWKSTIEPRSAIGEWDLTHELEKYKNSKLGGMWKSTIEPRSAIGEWDLTHELEKYKNSKLGLPRGWVGVAERRRS